LVFLRSVRRLLVAACVVPSSPILSPWWRRRQVPPKRRFLQEPHGVTTQKTQFFIVTAVKTSNLTGQQEFRSSLLSVFLFNIGNLKRARFQRRFTFGDQTYENGLIIRSFVTRFRFPYRESWHQPVLVKRVCEKLDARPSFTRMCSRKFSTTGSCHEIFQTYSGHSYYCLLHLNMPNIIKYLYRSNKMKNAVSWDITTCGLYKKRRFGGM
jgi:hypothetical protein